MSKYDAIHALTQGFFLSPKYTLLSENKEMVNMKSTIFMAFSPPCLLEKKEVLQNVPPFLLSAVSLPCAEIHTLILLFYFGWDDYLLESGLPGESWQSLWISEKQQIKY